MRWPCGRSMDEALRRNSKRLVWLEWKNQGRGGRTVRLKGPRSWSLASHRGRLGFIPSEMEALGDFEQKMDVTYLVYILKGLLAYL